MIQQLFSNSFWLHRFFYKNTFDIAIIQSNESINLLCAIIFIHIYFCAMQHLFYYIRVALPIIRIYITMCLNIRIQAYLHHCIYVIINTLPNHFINPTNFDLHCFSYFVYLSSWTSISRLPYITCMMETENCARTHRNLNDLDASLFSFFVSVQTFAVLLPDYVHGFPPCVAVCSDPVAVLEPAVI